MFFFFQIPIADLRCFVEAECNRVKAPSIAKARRRVASISADQPHGFVRQFGGVTERTVRSGSLAWDGEDVYCEAKHAIRFQGPIASDGKSVGSRRFGHATCVFRRFYASESCSSRLEIGMKERAGRQSSQWSSEFTAFARSCLATRVRTPRSEVEMPLAEIGSAIATHYLRATTQLAKTTIMRYEDWWVAPGAPLGFVEYDDLQSGSLPQNARSLPVSSSSGLKLDYARILVGNQLVGVWFCRITKKGLDRDLLRRIRINLFRLHSEIESVKYLTSRFDRQPFFEDILGVHAIRLERYLVKSRKLLRRRERFGLDQAAIVSTVQEYRETVMEGETPTLIAQITSVLDTLKAQKQSLVGPYTNIVVQPGGRVSIFKDIHNSTIVNESTLVSSFNKVKEDLGTESAEFLKTVAKTVHDSTDMNAGHVLNSFNEELQKKEPKRSVLQLLWNGLVSSVPTLLSIPGAAENLVKLFGLGT